MLWLQTPQWGRRLLAIGIAVLALWIELRPQATVEHPFAIQPVTRGTELGPDNTMVRAVPIGLFAPIPDGAVAVRDIAAGAPVLVDDVGDSTIPDDWWSVTIELPLSARQGDRVRVVVLDTGLTANGVVVSGPDSDPLGSGQGAVAMPADDAEAVAGAAVTGNLAVLVSTG